MARLSCERRDDVTDDALNLGGDLGVRLGGQPEVVGGVVR
jgi:hypothetical protein